ncbi:MAG: SPFH domain-containing protein [Lachnospiraceae bacterium]|nr:SPFH domain-containing protein [Lachnospiraceae bacterium]
MGLLRAVKDAIGSVVADQWVEYFYCDSISSDVLVVKGQKRVTEGRNSNTKGIDNIITNGSIVAVNEGQCMIIVDQGKITEFCAEAGEFVYDSSSEPSLLYGNLGENLTKTFAALGKRIQAGGNAPKDQRVYYFNTKEIMNNLFGTANPVPFRVVDANIGLDVDIALKCNGEYTYKIVDPLLFYTNVCGNVTEDFRKSEIASQLKGELLTALQPAFAAISAQGIRYSAVVAHTTELTEALNAELSEKWARLRGIEMVSMTINVKASEDDEEMIKDLQKTAVFRKADMAAANLSMAQAEAMKSAASNTSTGPMMAFAGMNMANMVGGMDSNTLFGMAQNQQTAPQANVPQGAVVAATAPVLGWTCACGKEDNRGKFCSECGAPKPSDAGWTCACGHVNQGKFCVECGAKKPEGAPLYKCDKCGWEPEDPANPPKFCPECGDAFNELDRK